MIHLDTSFLIDLLRESGRGVLGPAHELLDQFQGEELVLSVFAVCELHAGVERSANPSAERARVQGVTAALEIAYPDDRFAPVYGRLLAWLHERGETIATMDLLIATAALVDEGPLVSRNRRHFDRVPGLKILSY